MSRFFTGGSSSESEEEVKKDDDEDTGIKIPSKYARPANEKEEEENLSDVDNAPKKRVVRSAKEKIYEELNSTANSIKNSVKIKDWNKISTDFEKLTKQLQSSKVAQQLQKEGITTPRLYLKTVVLLEDLVKKTSENKAGTKMNGLAAKAFNAMKQKLKKLGKSLEKELEAYKKDMSGSEESEEWNPDEDSSEGEAKEAPEEVPVKASPEDEERDSASESGGESGSGSEEDKPAKSKWFIQTDKRKPAVEVKPDVPKVKTVKPGKKPTKTVAEAKEERPTEMTPEEVKAKLKDILLGRGKRGTDSMKQVERLSELVPFAKEPQVQVEILIHLVSSQFDVNRSVATHLPIHLWKGTLTNLGRIIALLEQNPSLVLQEGEKDEVEEDNDDNLDDEEAEQKMVSGNLVAFVQRLDDEFNKSLQSIDPHTQDYVQRLQDETLLLELAERAQAYYERAGMLKPASRIAARRVEHIYYKLDAHHARATGVIVDPPEEKKDGEGETKVVSPAEVPKVLSQLTISPVDNKDLLEKLASMIYTHGDERMKTRTMLCHIYYHAIHDRFYEARDMMLMSHLQESINHMDITTQILFNRAMVQLGLCAFRNNLIKQAHSSLAEIYAGGRVKELLAQGVTNTRFSDKTQEQEKQERKRQLPYHMHINLELLEAIHLICALLLEVPNMAANQFDVKKKVISRSFRRLLDYFDRSVFAGPPENTRDVIITAAKALSRGDWKRCEELLLGLPVWNLVNKSDQVKAMVRRKIQEEGLRTYLFTYSAHYDSMSLEQLSQMFELPKNTVHSIVSKMMIAEELHASWDQPTGAIVMHKVEPTRLQYLAQQFAEKAATFVENNERILDSRMGGYGYKYDAKPQQKDRWQDRDRDGRGAQRDGQRRDRRPDGGRNFNFQHQHQRQGRQGQDRQGGGRDNRGHSYSDAVDG